MKIELFLIDDDKVSLLITRKYLIISGIKELVDDILIFDEATDALDLLNQSRSINEVNEIWILLDINMPKVNGWDFLSRLNTENHKSNIKVIMLTSSISEEDKNMAASYQSVYGYFSKPLDTEKCKEIKQIMLESANT